MRRGALIVPVFLAIFLLVAVVPGGPWGRHRVLFAIFVESALLAIAAPIPMGWMVFLALPAAGAVAAAILSLICAPEVVGSVLLAHLVLAAFAGFLRALSMALGRPFGPRAAVVAASLLGLALLVTPFAIDPVLQFAGPGPIRPQLLRAALLLNPPAAISQSLFGVDWIREGSLYTVTRFASSQPFAYPSWTASAAAYSILWAVVAALGRPRRKKETGVRKVEMPPAGGEPPPKGEGAAGGR